MQFLLYFNLCFGYTFCVISRSADFQELTDLFFDNLQESTKSTSLDLNDELKKSVDLQVENYVKFTNRGKNDDFNSNRKRRGLDKDGLLEKDANGVQKLKEFKEILSFNTKSPQDMTIFRQKNDLIENWYAAIIEGQSDIVSMHLVIYKFDGEDNFVELQRVKICHSHKLSSVTMENYTIIVVAECCAISETSGVYQFNLDDSLQKIQTLNMSSARDVAFWYNQNEIYMSIAQHLTEANDVVNYHVETPIYKWLGTYFDIVNSVTTYGAETLTGFTIASTNFVVVANRFNNNGQLKIYSEIFKYNRHLDQFVSHQKILTNGAVDVKYFCFQQGHSKESYIIVTDSFLKEKNEDDVITEFNSVIYKYVHGYFVPFQSIKINDLIEWQPFVGSYEQFALIAVLKKKGVKMYQYDGWQFVPVEIENKPEKLSTKLSSVHTMVFMGVPVVVTANRNSINVFEVIFEEDNQLNELYDEMLQWCNEETKKIDKSFNQNTNETGGAKTKRDITQNLPEELNGTENNVKVNLIELQNLQNILESRQQILNDQESEFHQPILEAEINVIEGDIIAENVIVNNEAFLNHLIAESINDVNVVDFLNNVINIKDGFVVGQKFELERISVLNDLTPKFVNDHKVSDILTTSSDITLENLIVEGKIIFKEHLDVQGTVNDIKLIKQQVLLLTEDQIFNSDLNVTNIEVNKLTTKLLNKLEVSQVSSLNSNQVFVNETKKLKAESVIMDGYINLVDISTIDKFVLRNSGDQNITAEYIFDELITSNLEVLDTLSGVKIPDDLVRIDEGTYNLAQDVQFSENVTIDNLILTERFNQIHVKDGKLDVLLKESDEEQEITGVKTMDEVELVHPVNLQGKLKTKGLEKMNPLTIVDEDIVLEGDFVLSGDVTIEEKLIAQEIASEESIFSLSTLKEFGLKLLDKTLEAAVEFTQPIIVGELFSNTINMIDTNSWIVKNSEETQYIDGTKEINGDLFVDGDMDINLVNGINMKQLLANTLMINGDQTISGNVILDEIEVEGVTSIKTKIGQREFDNILLSSDDQLVSGVTEILNPQNLKSINTKFLDISGTVNNIKFDELIQDTVFRGEAVYKFTGHKTVQKLISQSVSIKNSEFDMQSAVKLLNRPEIVFDTEEVIRFPNDLDVLNLTFKNKLNNITASKYDSGLLKSGPSVTFTEDQYFDKVVIVQKAFVTSNHINSLNLTDLHVNALRHTEDHEFLSGTFDEVLSSKTVELGGHVENLDLENIVVNSELPHDLFDNLVFLKDVFVEGVLSINGSINSKIILQEIWDLAKPTDMEAERHMIINGNAIFAKGPDIENFNGFKPKELLETAWIPNTSTKFNRNVVFDKVLFKKDLKLDGFLDQVNIEWLANNYLSRTKDQNITAHYFINGINFARGVSAPSAKVKGNLFGINLLEFMRTAILDTLDQVFEDPLFIEQTTFNILEGEYLVNNMNLQNDVMRYDIENIVTGVKTISNVNVGQIQINPGAMIQNVDMHHWIENAALKTQSFQLKGKVVINNTTFENGIALEGLLNNNIFNEDTVMLKNKPQNISGIKTFKENPVIFYSILGNDMINGVNLTEVLENQVYKNEEVILNSQINLHSTMSVDNVEFNSLWNGVNFSKMVNTMKDSEDIEYHHEKYDNLLMISHELEQSAENRAYFLDDYKLEGTFENAIDVLPIRFYDGNHRLAILRKLNQTNIVSFFIRDEKLQQFVVDTSSLQIIFNLDVTYINVVDFAANSYLYMETKLFNYTTQTTHQGNLIRVSNQSSFEIIHKIANNCTKLVHSLILPDLRQNCLVFLYKTQRYIEIFCEIDGVLRILQKLEVDSATYLTSSNIDNVPYIILINGASDKGEACVQIWKFDQHTRLFELHQIIHVVTPNSLSVAVFNDVAYLAISSESIEETAYAGQVELRRFNQSTSHFTPYQTLPSAHLPQQVLFAVLPTTELALYVRTGSPQSSLLVYGHRGVQGFAPTLAAGAEWAAAPADQMRAYTDRGRGHFVLLRQSQGREVHLVRAVTSPAK